MIKGTRIVFLLFALLFGCRKAELPPDITDDPDFVFYTPVDLFEAGNEDIFMCTGSEQTSAFRVRYGYFTTGNCTEENYPGSLRLAFWTPADTATPGFIPGVVSFRAENPATDTVYNVSFNALANGFAPDQVEWFFHDNDSAVGLQPQKQYDDSLDYQLVLKATSPSGVAFQLNTVVNPALPINPCSDVQVNFMRSGGVIFASLDSASSISFTAIWSNGETSPVTFFVDTTIFAGVTLIGLTQNCFLNYNIDNLNNINQSETAPNFTFETEIATIPSASTSGLMVTYTSPDGEIWRSSHFPQPGGSFAQINTVEPYAPNANGNAVVRLFMAFSCILWNESGESLPFTGEGTIGVEQ